MYLVKIKLNKNATKPKRMTPDSAGYDLYASEYRVIPPDASDVIIVPTGIFLEQVMSQYVMICPRSGLALKRITVANSPGIIDADYRGEIMVELINFGEKEFIVNPKDRIAQLIVPYPHTMVEVDELTPTVRNTGGFGSTGIN